MATSFKLSYLLAYLFVCGENLVGHNLGIYLRGFDVGMTEHLADNFDGDTRTEGNGSGEGVATDVCSDGLGDADGKSQRLEVAVVNIIGKVWQLEVVALEDVHDGRQEREHEGCAGFLTDVVWDKPCVAMLLSCGEVYGHEVGISKAGVTLDNEEVAHLSHEGGAGDVVADKVDFVNGEDGALARLPDGGTESGIRIVCDEAKHDGIVDVGLDDLVIGVYGWLQHLPAIGQCAVVKILIKHGDGWQREVGEGVDVVILIAEEVEHLSVIFLCAIGDGSLADAALHEVDE